MTIGIQYKKENRNKNRKGISMLKSDIKIRDMRKDDYLAVDGMMQELQKIHLEARPDLCRKMEHVYERDEFERMLLNPEIAALVAEDGEDIVGLCFVTVRTGTCMVNQRTAYMDDLFVKDCCRGSGVGCRLFECAKKTVIGMGAERLDLMVWEFNHSAFQFYESMGMRPQRYIMEMPLKKGEE